ncbi:MAG: PVC-type heme-binding CxxCH protein [Planctomycetota bacterium]
MTRWSTAALLIAFCTTLAANGGRFETVVLDETFQSEGVAVADIDGDSVLDIVSGPFWYAGPDFRDRHAYADIRANSIAGYSDYFFTFARDFDGDGDLDLLSIPIPGGSARIHFNPGTGPATWPHQVILDDVGNESPTLMDFDGDGKEELVCIHGGRYGLARPGRDVRQRWKFQPIGEQSGLGKFTHGMGVGDVDGDGLMDLLVKDGWWRQSNANGNDYEFYPVKFAESGGAQMFVYDFDGDGDNDVVSSQNAHGFGLSWFERRGESPRDFLFVEHVILGDKPNDNPYGVSISQLHALALADIDGDGVKDLVTGKRFWAHGGTDSGAHELPVLYWFKTRRGRFGVDFVPMHIAARVGVGTQLATADVDANGYVDIVVGNKLGTFLLLNHGETETEPAVTDQPRSIVGTSDFAGGVRSTDPLSPEDERATFVLPEGFEAQLFAAEPDIAKPLNMAFDYRGRLWITNTIEYPYPAPDSRPPRDSIKILEDTDGDGRADKVTTFADELNIPMGLYPYKDGVICFSIPNILFLRDTDGDDVADERQVLYGPFDTTRDTHGMCNAFTRGYDGWLYACHGFNNQSTVSGRDGHSVTMHSGNTFRIRLDGSRIEHFTHGQVNPFGMAFDPHGDVFSADCHTKPITLLIPGGYHESFGAPHDGLGFTPPMMQHLHGSTAIGGLALYHGDQFPPVYRGNAFGGNVMTSRINRNSIHHSGASVRAQEEPDFLISGDPWFRPVDLQVGPDGALYVADFYNKIIGHYEVPLDHPDRDRSRGRIWRIVYKPTDRRRDAPAVGPESFRIEEGLDHAVESLGSKNMTTRMLATDAIVDRYADTANEDGSSLTLLRVALEGADDADTKIHLLWALARLKRISKGDLDSAIRDEDARVREHGFRILAESDFQDEQASPWLTAGLQDPSPRVRRSAATAAASRASPELVKPLLTALRDNRADPHLRHAVRIALRNHLREPSLFQAATSELPISDRREVAEICLAIETEYAGRFIAENLNTIGEVSREQLSKYLTFACRYASLDHLTSIIAQCRANFGDDVAYQEELLRSVDNGFAQRGQNTPEAVRKWAESLARRYLELEPDAQTIEIGKRVFAWRYVADVNHSKQPNPWQRSTKRNSVDGEQRSALHSSFPAGESKVGIYRSDPFELADQFGFFIAGHDGFPDKPLQNLNYVRVRDAATLAELKRWPAPRNDTAQEVKWETAEHAGRRVYVELIDGDTAGAYAWLAVGRFSVEGLNPQKSSGDRHSAATLVKDFRLQPLIAVMSQLMSDPNASGEDASLFAKAYASARPSLGSAAIAEAIAFQGTDGELRRRLIALLTGEGGEAIRLETLGLSMKIATAAEQRRVALDLASHQRAANVLLELVENGDASARVLVDSAVRTKLESFTDENLLTRVTQLVAGLPNEDEEVLQTMADRKRVYLESPGDRSSGIKLFRKHCANCHRVAGQGAEVGPNLDGIGNRGLDRLIEDVLQPSRNIDAAFRATAVLTQDRNVFTGLIKRVEGKQTVLVDQNGKEQRILSDEIDERRTLRTSPMPANFHESLNERATSDLLAYLLSLTS